MRHYFLVHGDQPTMAVAEVKAALAASGVKVTATRNERDRLLLVHTPAPWRDVATAAARLGLTHEAGPVVAVSGYDEAALRRAWRDVIPVEATVAGRAERLAPGVPWTGGRVERLLGDLAARRVNLSAPDVTLRGLLTQDRVVVGWRRHVRIAKVEHERHVSNRPFFSPISIEPKWARALVNLARVGNGGLVVDPLVGTGGVLLEAADMGCRVAGSDLDDAMVAGTARNFEHFGITPMALACADVQEAASVLGLAGAADAVVSDLPYGRSASTGREATASLYARAARAAVALTRPGARVVLGTPGAWNFRVRGLRREATFTVRVHRSLTRHFHVFVRT